MRLPHEDKRRIEQDGQDLWNAIFTELDGEFGGEMAGRVATATEKAFVKAMTKELEVDD